MWKTGEPMQAPLRISQDVQGLLCCPVCHAGLSRSAEQFACADPGCATRFPIVEGIPVLINERSSVFSIDDFIAHRRTFFRNPGGSALKKTVRALIPDISNNIAGESNYRRMGDILLGQSAAPRVFVIGGSILGQGMEPLTKSNAIQLVESDVSFGPRTALICDAHDLPFEDGSFDGVIVQAVLEHVVDPIRCCEEIYRVLTERGVVYAETPFMQQVHGGCYDFMRFTHLGHRRLFRRFVEIDSGAACGPGMALAWSDRYFLLSFTRSRRWRALLKGFASLTSFFLKYFDYYLIDKPGTFDAASGYYFMGRKAEHALSDRELITLYKGAG
jgi:SAM-dependent methyltransferase